MKETLKKERSEIQSLKRKNEDMISEVEVSKAECQTLQVDKDDLVISVGNIEKENQATLAEFEKLQQRYQMLEAERDNLRLLVEELNKGKRELEYKVIDMEVQNTTVEGESKLYESQIVALEEQKNSLAVSLKTTMEQKDDVEPLKRNALTIQKNIHQMQL